MSRQTEAGLSGNTVGLGRENRQTDGCFQNEAYVSSISLTSSVSNTIRDFEPKFMKQPTMSQL